MKKVFIYSILFIAILSFIYVLARFIPGDPITVLYGEVAGDIVSRKFLEHQLGFDKPIYIQILMYIGNVFFGGWGKSIYTGESVALIVFRGFIASFKLAFLSTLLVFIFCIAMLYIEFVYSFNGRVLQFIALVLGSMPIVVWGAILLLFLILFKGSVVGDITPPLILLTIAGIGVFYRLFRSAIEYGYQQPFVATYAMMGFSRRYVFLRVLRYSLPVALSTALYRFGLIIAGAIVAETMFMYPGMGFIFYTALLSRDYPVLIGWGVAISITLITINFVIDVIHSLLDPRVVQH